MLLATIIAIAAIIMISASFVVLRRERNDGLTIDPPDLTDVVDISDVLPGIEVANADSSAEREPVVDDAPRPSFRERLAGARSSLSGFFGGIFAGGIDRDTWEALEEALIRADVGVATSTEIMEAVKAKVEAHGVEDATELPALVKAELVEWLSGFDRSLSTNVAAAGGQPGPAVWLFVGVNGVGKTTTIGKLAKREVDAGRKIMLAAGDTFRAAAAEQLTMWAERSDVAIVRGAEGADPSSVVFDAVESMAKSSMLTTRDWPSGTASSLCVSVECHSRRAVSADPVTSSITIASRYSSDWKSECSCHESGVGTPDSTWK